MTPPSADTIRAIRVLVTGALGLQEDRGDQVVVESLPVRDDAAISAPTAVTTPTAPVQRMPLALSHGCSRRRRRNNRARDARVCCSENGAYERCSGQDQHGITSGGRQEKHCPVPPNTRRLYRTPLTPSLHEASPEAAKMDRLVGTVRTAVGSDPTLVAGVLRNWLEER